MRAQETQRRWHVISLQGLETNEFKYATLDNHIFGHSPHRRSLRIYRDSRRGRIDRENYLLHLPGVLCHLFDYRRIQAVGLEATRTESMKMKKVQ